MLLPIGGPRIWRRLVSRWWRPTQRMQNEWEQRAQTDALGYIGRGYAENDAMFWTSGRTDVDEQILDGIKLEHAATALEIGCGVGRLMRPLANRLTQINGVDIAPSMIAKGRTLLSDLPNARLEVTDGELGIFPDDSHDFVYSFVVFQHIPSKRAITRYICEAARILKTGGILKFQIDGRVRSFWRGSDTWLGVWFRPREIQRILKRAGFSLIDAWGEETQYYWITARLDDQKGPECAKAQALNPKWNVSAVTSLMQRLGVEHEAMTAAIISGQSSLHDVIQPLAKLLTILPDRKFVQTAFRTILDSEADESGLNFYLRQLQNGVSHSYIIDYLLSSAEMRSKLRLSAVTKP